MPTKRCPSVAYPFANARLRRVIYSIFAGVCENGSGSFSVIYLILNSNLNLTFSVCLISCTNPMSNGQPLDA